ncbi:hypothetical protein [Streptomyces sp. NPDC005805]|uniref:hypothetical protein n=1 Tax=Streptomyces sp. NPDC005805 TaxID=3157068 RepID=UPI0033ECF47F
MITRHLPTGRARFTAVGALTAVAALLLTGCSADAPAEPPHPVFSAPEARQPAKALEATLAARGFAFRQTMTFELGDGKAVLTSEGRMDPKAERATGTRSWTFTGQVKKSEREALLGDSPAPSPQPAELGVAVDGPDVLVRPGSAPYWIRHTPDDVTVEGNHNAAALVGTAVPFGGTLLELADTGGRVTKSAQERTGRTYTVRAPAQGALALLPKDMQDRLLHGNDRTTGAELPVGLGLRTDGEGRLTGASADFGTLVARDWAALRRLKGITAELTISRLGAPAPKLPPAARQLAARDVVREMDDLEPGACFDPHTGTSADHLVVSRPCKEQHGGRILAQSDLNTDWSGIEEARRLAGAACHAAVPKAPAAWLAESAKKDAYWYTWPGDEWDRSGDGVARATCYVLTR